MDKRDIFIEKARLTHQGENLDYSKVDYKNKSTAVCIIDHDLRPDGSEYGEYWQRPENHLRGVLCYLTNLFRFLSKYRLAIPQ